MIPSKIQRISTARKRQSTLVDAVEETIDKANKSERGEYNMSDIYCRINKQKTIDFNRFISFVFLS
jgi:macrodomain Ter protein organizer (MatP/YcbG family)